MCVDFFFFFLLFFSYDEDYKQSGLSGTVLLSSQSNTQLASFSCWIQHNVRKCTFDAYVIPSHRLVNVREYVGRPCSLFLVDNVVVCMSTICALRVLCVLVSMVDFACPQ